eukprot:608595-Rhodomonas_salina.2
MTGDRFRHCWGLGFSVLQIVIVGSYAPQKWFFALSRHRKDLFYDAPGDRLAESPFAPLETVTALLTCR